MYFGVVLFCGGMLAVFVGGSYFDSLKCFVVSGGVDNEEWIAC
jgi:hypothetical protein